MTTLKYIKKTLKEAQDTRDKILKKVNIAENKLNVLEKELNISTKFKQRSVKS